MKFNLYGKYSPNRFQLKDNLIEVSNTLVLTSSGITPVEVPAVVIPMSSSSSSSAPTARRNRWGPKEQTTATYTAPPLPAPQIQSMTASINTKKRSRSETENEEITRLAETFDSHDDDRLNRLLAEQQELQLLESRIRDAAKNSSTKGNTRAASVDTLNQGQPSTNLNSLYLDKLFSLT